MAQPARVQPPASGDRFEAFVRSKVADFEQSLLEEYRRALVPLQAAASASAGKGEGAGNGERASRRVPAGGCRRSGGVPAEPAGPTRSSPVGAPPTTDTVEKLILEARGTTSCSDSSDSTGDDLGESTPPPRASCTSSARSVMVVLPGVQAEPPTREKTPNASPRNLSSAIQSRTSKVGFLAKPSSPSPSGSGEEDPFSLGLRGSFNNRATGSPRASTGPGEPREEEEERVSEAMMPKRSSIKNGSFNGRDGGSLRSRVRLSVDVSNSEARMSLESSEMTPDRVSFTSARSTFLRAAQEDHRFEVLEMWARASVRRNSTFMIRRTLPNLTKEIDISQVVSNAEASPFMIPPSALPRLLWDVLGVFMVCYDCLDIPMMVFDPDDSWFMVAMDWSTRVFWTANIPVSFRTGYMRDDGTLEMNWLKIAKYYGRTWLPIDMMVVTVDWAGLVIAELAGGVSRIGNVLRLLRIVRLVRILRLVRMPETMDFMNEHIQSESVMLVGAITKILLIMLGVNHIIACGWYGVSRASTRGADRWITAEAVEDLSVVERYTICLYWALGQYAGTSAIDPENNTERLYALAVLLLAIVGSSAFVGGLTTAMTQLQMVTSQQASQLSALRRFLADQNISRPLAARVYQNAQHAQREQKKDLPEDSVELLRHISTPLMIEMHFEVRSKIILAHPFFDCYNAVNSGGIRGVCHSAVSFMDMHGNDVLFSSFEVPAVRRMFFVDRGTLSYFRTGDLNTETAAKGSWMCEAVLWTHWTHCGTMRAITTTRLLALDAEKLHSLVGNFPSDHVKLYATSFVAALNKMGQDGVSDLNTLGTIQERLIDKVFGEDESETSSVSDEGSSASAEGNPEEEEKDRATSMSPNPAAWVRNRISMLHSPTQDPPGILSLGGAHRSSLTSSEGNTGRRRTSSSASRTLGRLMPRSGSQCSSVGAVRRSGNRSGPPSSVRRSGSGSSGGRRSSSGSRFPRSGRRVSQDQGFIARLRTRLMDHKVRFWSWWEDFRERLHGTATTAATAKPPPPPRDMTAVLPFQGSAPHLQVEDAD